MSNFSFQQVAYVGSDPRFVGRIATIRIIPNSIYVDAQFESQSWREFYASDFGLTSPKDFS